MGILTGAGRGGGGGAEVLPEGLAKDPERLARLEREARVLASPG